ncbi:hypothetical protein [Propionibacterium acidifaciens]|uniref:hypothetical protein n=1 Tax=Propionibacterium acidifaciens TaxID=556499 RepID=UPI0028E4960D|nr:hypothetical protein [Propionibacterium acidifaciens]
MDWFNENVSTSDSGSDYSVSVSDAYQSAGDAAGAGDGFVPAGSGGPGEQWAPAAAGDWAPAGSGGDGGGVDPAEECRRLVANPDPTVTTSCLYAVRTAGPDTPASGGPAAGPAVDPVEVARRAVASLTLTEPGLLLDPDPAVNEWGATAVGFHTWFHAPGPGVLHTSVTADGLTVEITAAPGVLTVDTGDGRRQTCRRTVPYRNPDGVNAPSPYCGHTWEHTGEYTVTATRTWNVSWTAAGRSGTDTVTRPAGTRAVTVIELISVLTEPDP